MLKQRGKKITKSLKKETMTILKDLSKLKLEMPSNSTTNLVSKISKKFLVLENAWQSFSSNTLKSISNSKSKATKYIHSLKLSRKLQKSFQKDKKRIKSQETLLKKRELRLGKSLDKIKGLWQENISDMESSLKAQKETLMRISQDYFTSMKKIESEINYVLEVPAVPQLNLKKIHKRPSGRNLSNQKYSKKEFKTNRSSHSAYNDDIASFRSCSSRNMHSVGKTIKKCKGIQEENINSLPSFGKPESKDYQGESVSMQEIKEALSILKKANLINNSGNAQLLKIAELVKDPDNTSNVELMLQLIEIENRKNRVPNSRLGNSQKKSRLRIKRKKPDDLDDTSREKFKFSEEKSFNRTLLSNNNLLSPNYHDEGQDFGNVKDELNDVKLEDLLNVASLIEDLGLVSADNSIIETVEDETKRDKELFSLRDELPIKLKN